MAVAPNRPFDRAERETSRNLISLYMSAVPLVVTRSRVGLQQGCNGLVTIIEFIDCSYLRLQSQVATWCCLATIVTEMGQFAQGGSMYKS